jgi:hypothetical protein
MGLLDRIVQLQKKEGLQGSNFGRYLHLSLVQIWPSATQTDPRHFADRIGLMRAHVDFQEYFSFCRLWLLLVSES